jgi:hypothetical protein
MCGSKSKQIMNLYRQAKKEIPVLLFRRFKSAHHAHSWVDYEKILAARSLCSSLSRIIFNFINIFTGQEIWQQYEDYMNKGGPPNADLADQI